MATAYDPDQIPVDPAKLASGRAVRAMLEEQAVSLRIAADTLTALPETRAEARKYLGRVDHRLTDTDLGLHINGGFYGENGWAPAIADICRRAAMYEVAPNAVLDGMPISKGEAMAHRSLAA